MLDFDSTDDRVHGMQLTDSSTVLSIVNLLLTMP